MLETITIDQFKSQRRENLLDYGFYKQVTTDIMTRIKRLAANMANPDWMADKTRGQIMLMTGVRAEYGVKLMTISFSAGVAVQDLRSYFPTVLEYWEEYARRAKDFDESDEYEGSWVAHIPLQGDEYYIANRLISFAILLGWPQLLPRIAAIIEYRNPKRDAMLERILAISDVPDRDVEITECTRHLPYTKTLKIFDAAAADRPRLMEQYLTEWYVASRREPYYNSLEKGSSFVGYWSWEAATISYLLDLDDANYVDAMFYPNELVEFARAARTMYYPVGASVASSYELRAKSGDKCPRTGLWESLTIPSTARPYAEGEIMDNASSAYGITVWRLALP